MNDNVKRENRKALPRFLLILLGSGLLGGVLGGLSSWLGYSSALDGLELCLGAVVPWLIPAVSLALLAAALWQYRRAGVLFAAWDGEDEETMDAAESCLNRAMLLITVAMVLAFFLLSAASYSVLPGGAPAAAGAVVLLVALVMVMQQKVVDLTKRMNPEKRGSVYDVKFQEKWLDSCDEAERQQIGQASYRAYRVTGMACLTLWVVLLILDFAFGTGVLPSLAVLLLWGILQVSYILECIRLGKREK